VELSRLSSGILANIAGQAWSGFLQIAFVPVYLRLLGIEAYGLIGFFAMLQVGLMALDLGLSPTISRELARCSAVPAEAGRARDLVRSLEAVYWSIGLAIGTTLFLLAPLLASRWIRAGSLGTAAVVSAVRAMGVLAALQWPVSFYQGGLLGLQRQVTMNLIRIGMTTLAAGGAALVLWRFSSTITVFFAWQAVAAAAHVSLLVWALWSALPAADHPPRASVAVLRRVAPFASGLAAIAASGLVLSQLDKALLSRLLPLESFGYYALANVACSGAALAIAPVFNMVFPRLSALAAAGDEAALRDVYHAGSQAMTAVIVPIGALLALFSYPILLLWTRDPHAARVASPLLCLLVTGTTLNGLVNLPYALQLAHGWTTFSLRMNGVLILLLVPAILFMATRYGAVGGAAVWAGLNVIYLFVAAPFTHRRLLRHDLWRWLGQDVAVPAAAAVAVTLAGRLLLPAGLSPAATFASLASLLAASFAAAALATPLGRAGVRRWALATP